MSGAAYERVADDDRATPLLDPTTPANPVSSRRRLVGLGILFSALAIAGVVTLVMFVFDSDSKSKEEESSSADKSYELDVNWSSQEVSDLTPWGESGYLEPEDLSSASLVSMGSASAHHHEEDEDEFNPSPVSRASQHDANLRVVSKNQANYKELARNFLGGACNAATGQHCNPYQIPTDTNSQSAPFLRPNGLVSYDAKTVKILPGSGLFTTEVSTIFSSTAEWSHEASSSFGIGGAATKKGATLSGSLAMGDVAQRMFGGSRRNYFAESKAHYSLFFADYTPKAVLPQPLAALNALPEFNKDDEAVRNQYFDFFSQFGTHFVRSVDFGGVFRQTALIDMVSAQQSSFDEATMKLGLALTFGKKGNVSLDMGSSLSTERQSQFDSFTSYGALRVNGGNELIPTMDKWLHTVKDNPKPVATQLGFIGDMFSGTKRQQLGAAYVAYLEVCPSDDQGVVCGGAGVCHFESKPAVCSCASTCPGVSVMDSSCQCKCPDQNKCKNGGILQPDCTCQCPVKCANCGFQNKEDCTCRCRGNNNHGWTGPLCEETWGRCHPGPGSGNPDGSCNGDNRCRNSGGGASTECKVTEVCCNTCCSSQCAPYGSSCSCKAFSCSVNPGTVCNDQHFDPNCACPGE